MKLHIDRDNFKDLIEIVSSELNLDKKNMTDVIEEFQLEPFEINVLSIKRTILDYKEKWSKAPIWNIINSGDLKEYYEERFGKCFVYGDLPDYEDVSKSINKIRSYIQSVE